MTHPDTMNPTELDAILATREDAELAEISRTASDQAQDQVFTDEYRLQRFALHLAAERERKCRDADSFQEVHDRLEAMTEEEREAEFQAEMAFDRHLVV
jgi:hypothetical protein